MKKTEALKRKEELEKELESLQELIDTPEGSNRVKTFEEACQARGYETTLPDVSMLPEHLRNFTIANYQMAIICEAINNGRKANWNDHSEYKYWPWFEIQADKANPSGFGFSDLDSCRWYADAFAPSRLCFFNSGDAIYAGKQFADIYKHIILY